ncbi:hypothetical protein Hanom_Chr08g00750181 [Helianthus anomalus]
MLILVLLMRVMLFDYDIHCDKMVIRICMMFSILQKLKKTNSVILVDWRFLVHIFCCRCLQI